MELYLCPANQINLQFMKIKTLILLLILSAGACTAPTHSSGSQDTQQWQQTIQQLNTLLKERKHQAAIDEGQQNIRIVSRSRLHRTQRYNGQIRPADDQLILFQLSGQQAIPSRHRISGQPQQHSLSATALQT